jgi:PAS domain S-box-containing protein
MNNDPVTRPAVFVDATADAIEELPLPYLELDAYGAITRANLATYALHPPEQGSLIGLLAWESMPPDEQQQNCAAYLMLMETGAETPPVLRSIYVASGEFRTFEMHRRLIRDAAGKPIGMRILSVDVTDIRRELEEMRVAQRWLECSLEAAPAAVIITDTMGFIQRFNPAAEALLGCKVEDAMGQTIEQVLPVLDYSSPEGDEMNYSATLERRTRGIITIPGSKGHKLRLHIRTAPVLDKKSGAAIGVVCNLRRVEEA